MSKEISKKKISLKKNFIFNLVYQILTLIMPLITTPYISRVLGAKSIGIYSYTFAIISTFIMIGSLGIATHGQKEISAHREEEKERTLLFWEIFTIRCITMSLAIFGFILYSCFNKNYFIYYIAQLPFLISAILDVSWLFQGIERFDIIVFRNLFVKILGIISIFIFVKKQEDLVVYLIILGGSQLIGNLTAWLYVAKIVKKPQIRRYCIIKHFKLTMVYFIPTIAYQIYAVLDRVMLGTIVNSELQNGYYEQAHKIINIIVSIYSAYNIVLRSRMAYYFNKNMREDIIKQFRKSILFVVFLSVSMSFGLASIAKGFVPWFFGPEYGEVVELLYIFCPMILVMGFSMCIGTHILTPGGLQSKANVAQCIAAIVNLVFNILLIPHLCAKGAAIASFLSQLSVLVIYLFIAHNYFNIKEVLTALIKNLIAGVIMFLVVYKLYSWFESSIILSITQIFIGSLIYISCLIVLKYTFIKIIFDEIKNKYKKVKGIC